MTVRLFFGIRVAVAVIGIIMLVLLAVTMRQTVAFRYPLIKSQFIPSFAATTPFTDRSGLIFHEVNEQLPNRWRVQRQTNSGSVIL